SPITDPVAARRASQAGRWILSDTRSRGKGSGNRGGIPTATFSTAGISTARIRATSSPITFHAHDEVRAGRVGGRTGSVPSCWSQQAAARPPSSWSRGGGWSQRSKRWGQRGRKRQPVGGRDGSGTSPGRSLGSLPEPSGGGTAPIRASL